MKEVLRAPVAPRAPPWWTVGRTRWCHASSDPPRPSPAGRIVASLLPVEAVAIPRASSRGAARRGRVVWRDEICCLARLAARSGGTAGERGGWAVVSLCGRAGRPRARPSRGDEVVFPSAGGGGPRWCLGGRLGEAAAVELEHVGGEAGRRPIRRRTASSPRRRKPRRRAVVLGVWRSRLDDTPSARRTRSLPEGVRRRCSISSIAVACGGGGPLGLAEVAGGAPALVVFYASRSGGPGRGRSRWPPTGVAGVGQHQLRPRRRSRRRRASARARPPSACSSCTSPASWLTSQATDDLVAGSRSPGRCSPGPSTSRVFTIRLSGSVTLTRRAGLGGLIGRPRRAAARSASARLEALGGAADPARAAGALGSAPLAARGGLIAALARRAHLAEAPERDRVVGRGPRERLLRVGGLSPAGPSGRAGGLRGGLRSPRASVSARSSAAAASITASAARRRPEARGRRRAAPAARSASRPAR